MYRIVGLESALRADIPRTMMDQLDKEVLVGGSAPKFPKGLLNTLTAPTAPTADVAFGTGLATVSSGIDGKFARDLNELKLVVGVKTMQVFRGLITTNTAVSLADYLKRNSAGLMCTSNMPAQTTGAGGDQHAILCKTGPGMQGNAVGKVWGGGVRIIRDELSDAGDGTVNITGMAFFDYAVLRTDGFEQLTFQVGV